MDSLARWLGAQPSRGLVVNAAMFASILGLAGSAALLKVGGGAVLFMIFGVFVSHAAVTTVRSPRGRHVYDFALTWAPGLLAAGLALVGLFLATQYQPQGLAFCAICEMMLPS